jgi:hypothetical protein
MTLPPPSPGKIPAFHTLGDDVFEDLCRELIQEEDDVQAADPAMGPVATLLMRRLWADLPKELRRLLENDQDLLRTLGVSMTSIVEIGPLRVERKAVWDALTRILRDGIATQLRTIDGHSVDVARASDSSPTFSVKCEAVGFDSQIGGEEFWLLSDCFDRVMSPRTSQLNRSTSLRPVFDS